MRRLLIAAALLIAAVASAADYELAPEGSNVHFSVPLMAVSKVTG